MKLLYFVYFIKLIYSCLKYLVLVHGKVRKLFILLSRSDYHVIRVQSKVRYISCVGREVPKNTRFSYLTFRSYNKSCFCCGSSRGIGNFG